jgi:hypothetical protein
MKCPKWFQDDHEEEYILNVVNQAHDLGHNSEEAANYLRKHLHERFEGDWQIKITPASEAS